MWNCITALIAEIKKCEDSGATISAITMAYVCIDTMTFLSLPSGRDTQKREDFINWSDRYITCHLNQPYKYRGIDIYGARCALLHAFGTETDFHKKNPDAIKYGYHDGGKHKFDPSVNEHLVIIGTTSFLNDIIHAANDFVAECKNNTDLRKRVETRLPKLMTTFPFSS